MLRSYNIITNILFQGGNIIMNLLSGLFTKGISVIFEFIGNFSVQDMCNGYFDEPEVPQELIDLHRN